MDVADIVMEAYAMESSLLRARKLAARNKASLASEICAVFLGDAMARVEVSARQVLGACSSPGTLRMNMQVLRRLAVYDPVDGATLRRAIAQRLLEKERYAL